VEDERDESPGHWFKLMCESSPDFMVIVDRQRRFRWVNRLYPCLTLEDVMGKPLDDFEHPSTLPLSREATSRAFETGEPQVFESRARMPDGQEKIFEVRCIPVVDHPDRLLLVTRDITERRTAERQRDAYQRQLRQSQKMEVLGRLAGGLAHDFNNLLTPILLHAQAVIDSLARDDASQASLREICESAVRASALTNQLLALGRRQIETPHSLQLSDIVRGMAGMLRRVVPENIRLDTEAMDDDARVWAEQGPLEQVFLNLVLNACDAVPRGGEIHVRAYREGQWSVLCVHDTGEGMSEETMNHLFEPFFTTKGTRGTGLGLVTAQSIVERCGGTVEVSSRPDEGTTFRVRLPWCAEPADPDPPDEPSDSAATEPHRTVLVVEDEDLVRAVVAKQLRVAGYEVMEAHSGSEALELLRQFNRPPALLLTDVVMPTMSGPDLAREMRTIHPQMPAVFMSGHPKDLLRHEDLASSQVLSKPFTKTQLLEAVTEGIRQKR
jgi:PAS domain S-box-containing protein